jgi:predicted HTH transcriptional regulator
MKDAIEWNEADILLLIKEKVQESLTLDYKKSDALGKADRKKIELSKDVSAFANSAGGVILYGMEEDQHYPTKPDEGLDPDDISKSGSNRSSTLPSIRKLMGFASTKLLRTKVALAE